MKVSRYVNILEDIYNNILILERKNSQLLIQIDSENEFIIKSFIERYISLLEEVFWINPILKFQLSPTMSSGNLAIMQVLAMLYDNLKNIGDEKNILLLLDEVEVYLHPNWQKKFLNLLVNFLSSKFKNINFHIILATHSPFLLSDIPKSNVVFLGDERVKIQQTFGANIQTLLSNSFFMEDGLMGEFAKGKINEIKEFYQAVREENKKTKNDLSELKKEYRLKQTKFEEIQKIIGEPFLQKIVKNQLEEIELILLGKDEAIDNEIKRLQELQKSFKNG